MRRFYACLLTLAGLFGLASSAAAYETVSSSTTIQPGNQTLSGTFGGSSALANYGGVICAGASVESLPEVVYKFTADALYGLQITTNTSYYTYPDYHIYLLTTTSTGTVQQAWMYGYGCDATPAVLEQGQTYYLVVEQHSNTNGAPAANYSFNLAFRTDIYKKYPVNGQISCGQSLSSPSSGTPDVYVYSFTLDAPQQVLARRRDKFDWGLSISKGPNNYSTISRGYFASAYLEAGTYYLILNQLDASVAPYQTVSLDCGAAATAYVCASGMQRALPNTTYSGTLTGASDKLFYYTDLTRNYPTPGELAYYDRYEPGAENVYKYSTGFSYSRTSFTGSGNGQVLIPLRDSCSENGFEKGLPGYYGGAQFLTALHLIQNNTGYQYPTDVYQPAGTHALAVEQGSATTSDAYSFSFKSVCMEGAPVYNSTGIYINAFSIDQNTINGYGTQYSTYAYDGSYVTTVSTGQSVPYGVTLSNTSNQNLTSGSYAYYLDLNNDGDFADAGEKLVVNRFTPTTSETYPLVLSQSSAAVQAAIGKIITLRVRASANPNQVYGNGCDSINGVTQDVLIRITAPYSQQQTVWARQGGGTGADRFNRTRTDVYGNVYAAGAFSGTATFDGLASAPPASGVLTATSYGGLDGVLTRYNKKGQLQWLVRFAGQAGDDEALGLATDKFGYAYVSGYFTGTMVIVPGTGSVNKTLVSAGGRDMFVAKIKADGTIVYAFSMGDTGDDQATGVDVAPDLRFYVSGSFRGNTSIKGISGTVVPLTSRGNYDAFLAKFSDIGTLYWAIQGGGAGNDFGYGAAADIDGGGYLLGSYEGSATFNSQPTAGVVLNDQAVGGSDGFILAVTQQGGIRWFRSYGGATNENVRDVAPDPLGDGVAAVGGFSQSADFDGSSTTIGGATTLTARGFYDAFTLRVDKQGNTKWVTKAGGYGQDQAYGVRMDRKGNVNVALGFTQSARNFGSASDNLTSAGNSDGLIVRLAGATGAATSSQVQIGAGGDDYAYAVDTADGDAVIGAGSFAGTISLGSRTLVSAGGQDAWLARFGTSTSGSVREGLDETTIVESTTDANAKLLAYPNPATGSLTLKLDGAERGQHTATLYGADGKEASMQMLEGSALSAGTSFKLPAVPGLYLLRLAGPDCVRSVRVTVR